MAKKRNVSRTKSRVRRVTAKLVSSKVQRPAKIRSVRTVSSGKRKMSESQEFEIMKLVLDKFLWLGFLVMGFGMYQSLALDSLVAGAWYMLAGAILLLLFLWVIVKEYEVIEGM